MDPKKHFGKRRDFSGPAPKVVGTPRTEFGTRLCQRIECTKCQKVDYVPVRIAASKEKFCRSCAEKVLATYEQGRQIIEKKVTRICNHCCRDFLVNEAIVRKKEQLLCFDCLRGFEVWRGKVALGKLSKDGQTRTLLTRVGQRTAFRK